MIAVRGGAGKAAAEGSQLRQPVSGVMRSPKQKGGAQGAAL